MKVIPGALGLSVFMTTVLVGLKLMGELNWSWWGVTSPLWSAALYLSFGFALTALANALLKDDLP